MISFASYNQTLWVSLFASWPVGRALESGVLSSPIGRNLNSFFAYHLILAELMGSPLLYANSGIGSRRDNQLKVAFSSHHREPGCENHKLEWPQIASDVSGNQFIFFSRHLRDWYEVEWKGNQSPGGFFLPLTNKPTKLKLNDNSTIFDIFRHYTVPLSYFADHANLSQ